MYSEESLLFNKVDQMIHSEVFLCIMMHEFLMFPHGLNASCHAYGLTPSNHHFLGSTGRHAWLSECAREFAKIFRRNQGKWHVWSWATSNSIRRMHGKLWFFQIWQCQSRLQDNVDWTSVWIVVSGQVYEICFWHTYRFGCRMLLIYQSKWPGIKLSKVCGQKWLQSRCNISPNNTEQ
jgi:hypothetical protein